MKRNRSTQSHSNEDRIGPGCALVPAIKRATIGFVLAAVAAGCGGNGDHNSTPPLRGKDASAAQVSTPEQKADPTDSGSAVVMRGDTVIDDTQATKSGPSQYWHSQTGLGVNNEMIWTYVNGNSVSNSATWRTSLGVGKYNVRVFIPRNYATTRNAVYKVQSIQGGNTTTIGTVAVNQYNYSDAWVDLGTYSFNGQPAVLLADNTGEAYSTKRMIGIDAVKFTDQGGGGGQTINVPCFAQTETAWASKKLKPSGYTMADSGCLVTAIASVINWAGYSTDPGKYCDWLGDPKNGGFLSNGFYQEPPKPLLRNYTNGKAQQTGYADWRSKPADLNQIKSEIDAGRPVVIEVHYQKSDNEKYMHWVTVVAYVATGSKITDFTIMDPRAKDKQLTTLNQHYNYTNDVARWVYAARFFSRS